jgi:hypothetical protein
VKNSNTDPKHDHLDMLHFLVLAISMFEKLERGKGERTAWQIFDDATDTFVRLSETPAVIGDQDMECIEAFCSHRRKDAIRSARKENNSVLFSKLCRNFKNSIVRNT